jgi:hypoxanthine phosphoribosyltransferase
MPSQGSSQGSLEARKSRYRERAYGLLAGMEANDYLDHLSIRRLVGGTASRPFYDLFGSRDGFLAELRGDATGPVSSDSINSMLRALVDSLASLANQDRAAAEKLKDLIEGGLRRWLEQHEEVRARARLILIAASPVDMQARNEVETMYERQMEELVSLYSAILDVLGRRPISALGSVERVAATISILTDGALLHARFRDPEEVLRLVRATVIPIIGALTVPAGSAEPPESVLLYAPEQFSFAAPGRWDRVLEPVESNVILGAHALQERIAELGRDISRDYADRDPIFVCVLKGAVLFFSDLIRHVTVPSQHEFMCVSSYEGTESSGEINIHMDLDIDIEGRHVLIVEDIVDTGQTIEHLLIYLGKRQPASLEVCTLLVRSGLDRTLRYVGFEVAKGYVIGMGIDLNQRYRQLPLIAQLAPASPDPIERPS